MKLKRSHVADTVPTILDLAEGEIGINTVDGKIYTRDNSNNIVLLGGLQNGSTLPSTDPATVGSLWNDAGVVKISEG